MSKVLVVDDSEVDRGVLFELLSEDPDLEVGVAENAHEALWRLSREPWDLLVTDLVMPGKTGLQLVGEVRDAYPSIPVIVVTSQGSEMTAVSALRRGAASYVPKQMIAGKLMRTIHEMLALSTTKRMHDQLLDCFSESLHRFLLTNDPGLIDSLVAHVIDLMRELRLCDASQRQRIGVAVKEALSNALYHGNLQVDPELRSKGWFRYKEAAEKRAKSAPYAGRRIELTARLSRTQVVFRVRDEGPGFDPKTLPDPTDPAAIEQSQSRGTILMRTLMDDVKYNAAGNEVTMVKRFAGGDQTAAPAKGESAP